MKLLSLGLSLLFIASLDSAKGQDLVSNPGFETHSFAKWSTQNAPVGSYYSVTDENPHSGDFAAQFGATTSDLDYIYQSLPTTVGTTYDLSYFLAIANANQTPDNEFVVNVGGTLQTSPIGTTADGAGNYIQGGLTVTDILDAGDSSYTEYTFIFTASSTDTNLIFGGHNGPLFDYLDDVSVTVARFDNNMTLAPEPSPGGLLLPALIGLIGWRRFLRRRC